MKKPNKRLSTRAARANAKAANRRKLIATKADAKLKKYQGKALLESARSVEREKTKRSLGRSAAISTAVANVSESRREAERDHAQLWNAIINGSNSSATENTGTSDNHNDSTTNTDRKN